MSEARDLFKDLWRRCHRIADQYAESNDDSVEIVMRELGAAIDAMLKSQPEPDPVPELPEWLRHENGDEWCITDMEGYDSYYRLPVDPDDLDRIAEACTRLAARERARRAQS